MSLGRSPSLYDEQRENDLLPYNILDAAIQILKPYNPDVLPPSDWET